VKEQIEGRGDARRDDIRGREARCGQTFGRDNGDPKTGRAQHGRIVGALADRHHVGWIEGHHEIGLLLRFAPRPQADGRQIECLVDLRLPAERIGREQVYGQPVAQLGKLAAHTVDQVPVEGQSAVDIQHEMVEVQCAAAGDGEFNAHSLLRKAIIAQSHRPGVYNDRMTEKAEQISTDQARRLQRGLIFVGILAAVIVAGLAVGLYFLSQNEAATRTVRDLFIIVLALEFMVLGIALVVLLVQLSRLILLLQMEIRPMLESANDAISTVRGTTDFLSENLIQPVIQLNSSLAGLRKVLEMFSLFRR
jgi:hypothetical protein